MTREQYARMTCRVRAVTQRLPGGDKALRIPTLLCAGAYLIALIALMVRGDARIVRAMLAPAACFLAVTVLRPIIGRQRPYDRYGVPPVGKYRPGKGKSMPSRHTASAAAIACAVIYAFPSAPMAAAMLTLCAVIAALRVCSGQHYISDVIAALAISFVLSVLLYKI